MLKTFWMVFILIFLSLSLGCQSDSDQSKLKEDELPPQATQQSDTEKKEEPKDKSSDSKSSPKQDTSQSQPESSTVRQTNNNPNNSYQTPVKEKQPPSAVEILQITQQTVQGEFKKLELKKDGRQWIYKVEVKGKKSSAKLKINAVNGKVLEVDMDDNYVSKTTDALVSVTQAASTVLDSAYQSFIWKIEYKNDYKILFQGGDGKKHELTIDANNGEIKSSKTK